MVISFNKIFKEPILAGTKVHTIREDPKCRWQKGKHIHFATGVRTSKYNCFKEGTCQGIRHIEIEPSTHSIYLTYGMERRMLSKKGKEELIKNDGFKHSGAFWEWFKKPFTGRIIWWVEPQY